MMEGIRRFLRRMRRYTAAGWIGLAALGVIGAPPQTAAAASARVEIIEPFVTLHTGPGRGYPEFYAVKRGEHLTLLQRRTDWFRVRTDEGKEGWAARSDIEKTLAQAGATKTRRDEIIDEYVKGRLEIAIGGGQLDDYTLATLRADYHLTPRLGVEAGLAQVSGPYNTSRIYSAHLLSEPFSGWRISPVFSLGIGQFSETPRSTLLAAEETNAMAGIAGIGARMYLSQRLLLRLEYRNYAVFVDDDRTEEFAEWSGGIAFFF